MGIVIHWLIQLLAIILLILGLAGLALPILPGWILIILALILLGEESVVGSYIHRRLPAPIQRRIKAWRAKLTRQ
jgi:uncharacterized protein YqgC (DUF456 family)